MKKYLVGGAVRDICMNLEPKDRDYVVVGATPQTMIDAGFKQVGADFPVFLDENGVEYALARTERKSGHGYNGFVTDHNPTVGLEEDLLRRDLTINSMAWDLEKEKLIDPYGGFDDIKAKVLRHVSPAFSDDPVRVLRLARFHARYGPQWTVAPETIALCYKMVSEGELSYLTKERVLKEIEKALGEHWPHLFFKTLFDTGAIKVLPELSLVKQERFARTLSWGEPKFNYAKLTTLVGQVDFLEDRLNVSTEWRRYAKMFRDCMDLLIGSTDVIDILHEVDAYRQADMFKEMLIDAGSQDNLARLFYRLDNAYRATWMVNFFSLTPEQQSTLKGPAIAAAIKEERRKVWRGY